MRKSKKEKGLPGDLCGTGAKRVRKNQEVKEIEEVKEVREYEATGRRSARQVIWPGWGPSRFRVNESVTTHDSRVPVTLSIV